MNIRTDIINQLTYVHDHQTERSPPPNNALHRQNQHNPYNHHILYTTTTKKVTKEITIQPPPFSMSTTRPIHIHSFSSTRF